METAYDSGNYTEHYIKKFCSTNPFFEAFQNLLDKKYSDENDNFDYGKEYEKYFKMIEEEHIKSGQIYDAISLLMVPKVDSVKKYCRSWFPKDPDIIGAMPGDKNLVVLMGFVLQLSADETNILLKASGFSELGGRIFDEAITIYSLNNKVRYDKNIEIRNKMKSLYDQFLLRNEKNKKHIKTCTDLRSYLNIIDEEQSNTVQKLTIAMTETVRKIENEEQLAEYVKSNALVFSEYRETSRRYMCKYLLARLEKEQHEFKKNPKHTKTEDYISHFVDNSIDYEKLSFEHVWKQFEKLYCYTTRVEDAADTDYIIMQYNEAEHEQDTNRSAHLLSKFINGEREIKRKFFILFLIFLGLRNINKINNCCANCGFDTISDKYIDNGFDDFVYNLLNQEDNVEFRLFLATVTEEIANANFVPPLYLYKKGEL